MEEARRFVYGEAFDPFTMAAIEPADGDPPIPLPPSGPPKPADRIRETDRSMNHVTYLVDASEPAYFLLAESYDRGWKAFLNGQEETVYPANLLFRAVYLPKGEHKLVFRYQPGSFYAGLWISLVCALGLLTAYRWS